MIASQEGGEGIEIMKKTQIHNSVVFYLVVLFLFSGYAMADKFKIRVIVSEAKVRLKPDLNSTTIANVQLGAILEAKKSSEECCEVTLPPNKNGFVVVGYIQSSSIQRVPEAKKMGEQEKPLEQRIVERTVFPPQEYFQIERNSRIEFGVRGGLNTASPDQEGNKRKLGFLLGGFLSYKLSRLFTIQPEVNFSMRIRGKPNAYYYSYSGGVSSGGQYGNYESSLTSVIEIPVLAKFIIPMQGTLKPIFLAGPYFGVKLSSSSGIEYGIIVGGGIEFSPKFIKKGKVLIDLRYSKSFKKIGYRPLRQPSVPIGYIGWWTSDFYYKTEVISINFGYWFETKK